MKLKAKLISADFENNIVTFKVEELISLRNGLYSIELLPNIENIEELVCKQFNISKEQMHSSSQKRECVLARQVCIYIDLEYGDKSLSKSASRFNKDHSTAVHSRTVINNLLDTDKEFKQKLNQIINKL